MGVGSELAVGELQAIAWQAARSQARRHPGADVDDLAQEALAAMLAALRVLKSAPVSLSAYLGQVAKIAVWLHGAEMRSPVRHRRDVQGLEQAAQTAAGRVSDAVLALEPSEAVPASQALEQRRWDAEVRAQVESVLAQDSADEQAILRPVLLGDAHPREVAAALGQPVQRVYVVALRAKRRILASAQLRALWRDLPSRGEG